MGSSDVVDEIDDRGCDDGMTAASTATAHAPDEKMCVAGRRCLAYEKRREKRGGGLERGGERGQGWISGPPANRNKKKCQNVQDDGTLIVIGLKRYPEK